MNTFYTYALLTALPFKGLLFLLILFTLCLVGIHIMQLARLGWEYKTQQEKKPPEKEKEKEKEEKKAPAQNNAQEPIYYIVERKTRRAKPTYGEPKQINFKSGS